MIFKIPYSKIVTISNDLNEILGFCEQDHGSKICKNKCENCYINLKNYLIKTEENEYYRFDIPDNKLCIDTKKQFVCLHTSNKCIAENCENCAANYDKYLEKIDSIEQKPVQETGQQTEEINPALKIFEQKILELEEKIIMISEVYRDQSFKIGKLEAAEEYPAKQTAHIFKSKRYWLSIRIKDLLTGLIQVMETQDTQAAPDDNEQIIELYSELETRIREYTGILISNQARQDLNEYKKVGE